MKHFILLWMLVLFVSSCTKEQSKDSLQKAPGDFAHVVYFWFENPENESERAAFEKSLFKFLNSSAYIVTKHVGTPAATTHRDVVDGSYTYSILLTFKNKADQDLYQEEEVHIKFIEESSHLWKRVVVYDSENILN